jgi:hypothetical protein
MRQRNDMRGVLGVLETCLRANFAGIESSRLYSETYYGAPFFRRPLTSTRSQYAGTKSSIEGDMCFPAYVYVAYEVLAHSLYIRTGEGY